MKSAAQSAFGGGTQDAFVAAFNPSGTPAANTLVYSTFLGGSLADAGNGVAVDGSKNVYVVGQTSSSNFPTAAPTQLTLGGGADGFVSEISASGSLVFSTYLGGTLNDNTNAGNPLNPVGAVAVDSAGANIYVAGNTLSSPFPTVSALQPTMAVSRMPTWRSMHWHILERQLHCRPTERCRTRQGTLECPRAATITVGSTNGFNSAVQLQCSVSPVVTKGPTCNFSTPSVTPPANGTTTSTLNVATTAASAMLTHPANGRSSGVLLCSDLAGIRPHVSWSRRRVFRTAPQEVPRTCDHWNGSDVSAAAAGLRGSSGGGGGGGGGTPTGAYTITVTGTNGATVVTGTPALTLTIN